MSHLGKVFSCLLLASVAISAQQPMPASLKSPISGSAHSQEASTGKQDRHVLAFGENGQIKMLYDRRQRPQSVLLNGAVYIVFNAGAEAGAEGRSPTRPMIVEYDLDTREFSNALTLGSGSRDHHYGPVIWADDDNYLHVLFGCHRTPGTHLISRSPSSMGDEPASWKTGPQIAPGISYPTTFRVFDNKQLVYFRTAGHTSSWTYRVSADNGRSWSGPDRDVTDLDIKGRTEWSSYHCVLPSKDGRFLHVVFMAYDDNKADDPLRYHNPRYGRPVSNGWKYNLYYLRIDLQTQVVTNSEGEEMVTPVDLEQANSRCRIWDTEWRGAGVPPTIALDELGNPAFLHVLSEDTLEEHRYYFVRRAGGQWRKDPVAPSNHQWNSGHLARSPDGTWHAYLITGEGYLATGGYMDGHGGGSIEEWVSRNEGRTWRKERDLTPDTSEYPGWKYNNVQPVSNPDGSVVEGMLLFYGWKHRDNPRARAFLIHDSSPN